MEPTSFSSTESKQYLIDILVPYFTPGLRSNEFCMWDIAAFKNGRSKEGVKKTVPDLDDYLHRGQIEIIACNDGYLFGGKFDSNPVLQGWVEKEKTL